MPDTTPRRGHCGSPPTLPQRIDTALEVIAHVVLSSPPPVKWDYKTNRETAQTQTIPIAPLRGSLWKSPLKMSCRLPKGTSRSQNRPQRRSEWTC